MQEIHLVTSGNTTMTELACNTLRAMYGEVKINLYRWRGPKKERPELPYVRFEGKKHQGFAELKEFVEEWNERWLEENLGAEEIQAS